jgi:hypothetical protein
MGGWFFLCQLVAEAALWLLIAWMHSWSLHKDDVASITPYIQI